MHDLHIDWPPAICVVLKEAGEKRLPRFYIAVLVQLRDDDIAADLPRPVPGAVAGDEDRVAVFWREHGARIEAHTGRGRVWTQQGDRFLELIARAAPAHLAIRESALMAVREAEVLATLGDAVSSSSGRSSDSQSRPLSVK